MMLVKVALFLHVISAIFWVGGMLFITLVVAPLGIPLVRTIFSETEGPPLIGVLKGTAQLQLFVALLLSLALAF